MKALSSKVVVALAVVSAVVSSVPAKAELGELAALMRSPVGRFLMQETEEGVAITLHAVGANASAGVPELEDVISRLGSQEMTPTARVLEERLSTAHSRFQALAAVVGGADAVEILQKVAAESLATRLGSNRELVFVAENKLNFRMESAAFTSQAGPSKLAGVDMSARVFEPHAKMLNFDLRFAEMTGSEAFYAHFEGSSMEFADLSEAKMQGADFHGANMHGAELRDGGFKGAVFRGTNLRGADMRGANFIDADFRGADLRGANMTGARMGRFGFQTTPQVSLRGALIDSHTKLPEGMTVEQAKAMGATFIAG